MLFSYNWLQSFFEKKLPQPAELAGLIIKHGFEVEGIEKNAKDTVFDINILSNRPDCISYIGMALEIGAMIGIKPSFPKTKLLKAKNPVAVRLLIDVEVMSFDACPRYTAKGVLGVKIGPSPKWIVERLESCGLRAINNVVDATNYVMLETGQPLHAFDLDKLQNKNSKSKAKKIIVRFAQKGEAIDALGDKIYKLTPETLLICDESGPLAVAGIKGGKRAEISKDTTSIVIESANFNPRTIRRASRNLGLQTDASYRFEHGLDASQADAVADRVAGLIVQTAGGQVMTGTVDRYDRPAKPKKMVLDLERAENLLGMDIPSAKAKKILELLGMTVKKGTKTNLEVTVPPRRTDISIGEDLIEEIGRIGGYDHIMPQLPAATVMPVAKNYEWLWKNSAKDALVACGYSETRNHTFISAPDCQNYGISHKNLLEVKNPVSADWQFLRPSLLPNLIKNIAANPEKKVLRQFEIGKIFAPDKRNEPAMVAGLDLGGSFYEVKGAVEFLCRKLGIFEISVLPFADGGKEVGQSLLDPAKRGQVMAGAKPVGFIGRLSLVVAEKIGIHQLPIIFELDLDVLAKTATRRIVYQPLSIYPEAVRDLSVDVPIQTVCAGLVEVIRAADSAKLIKSIEIPDLPYVAGQNKNILFKFHLHSGSKTLDSNEINDWQTKTIAAIESNPGWRVKK